MGVFPSPNALRGFSATYVALVCLSERLDKKVQCFASEVDPRSLLTEGVRVPRGVLFFKYVSQLE